MSGYIDDSGEWVRRKATAEGGHARSYNELARREYRMILAERAREFATRFPDGWWIQLPGQRIQIINLALGQQADTQIVRYHVAGDHTVSGSRRIHRMPLTPFLKMVGAAKAVESAV
jgi:hypothetical protein